MTGRMWLEGAVSHICLFAVFGDFGYILEQFHTGNVVQDKRTNFLNELQRLRTIVQGISIATK